MSDVPWSDWFSVPELAPRLGVSDATLKRRLAAWSLNGRPVVLPDGRSVEIQAEKVARPQGDEWRVRGRGALGDQSGDHAPPVSKAAPAISSAQDDAQGLTRALEAERALVTDVRTLERENGTLRAERDAEKRRADDLAERLAKAEAERDAERAEVRRLLERLAARRWWKPSTW